MKHTEYDDPMIEDVPVSPLLSIERGNRYGSIPGLDDDELADPAELERQIRLHDWEPIIRLQTKKDKSIQRDWEYDPEGAFNTHDYWQAHGCDLRRYDAAIKFTDLEEMHVRSTLSVILGRIPGRGKYLVLKCLRKGIIDDTVIVNEDMRKASRWNRRLQRVRAKRKGITKAKWRAYRGESQDSHDA